MKNIAAIALILTYLALSEARAQEITPEQRQIVESRVATLVAESMLRCWRMPTNEPSPERLVVTVQFELRADGSLDGAPRVISPQNFHNDRSMTRAVKYATRAVRRCSPYALATDPITGGHYELWRQMEFTFRPPPR
jgi:hypothetical protein